MDQIDCYVRGLSIDQINMNKFANYKNLLELGLLEIGKEVYFWPFVNAGLIVDRHLFKNDQKKEDILSFKSISLNKEDLLPFS